MFPIQTILHATDFSEPSGHAFRLACSVAREQGARLIVLHVAPQATAVGYDERPITVPLLPDQRHELETRLQRQQPAEGGLRIEHRLEEGEATEQVLAVAHQMKADLIVVGTHGRGGLGRLLLGSVAEQVIRRAECPVLAVKGDTAVQGAMKVILHPTDFSTRSRDAFRLACVLARGHSSRLVCLHVRMPPHAALYGGVPVVEQLAQHDADEDAKLKALKCEHHKLAIERRMEQGDAAEEILRVANEAGTDLIVMGTHGRTGLGRLVMGSVAENVLRRAPCPVLLVKSRHADS